MYPKSRMLLLSQEVRYAITGLRYLASKKREDFLLVQDIASATGLSRTSLAKVFQKIAHSEILESRRGPLGGYRLGRNSHKVTLCDLVEVIQKSFGGVSQCMVEAKTCERSSPCFLHETVDSCERLLAERFKETFITESGRGLRLGGGQQYDY